MKERNIGLDIIKGFAALLVCMLHLLRVDFGEVVPGETYIPNMTKIFYGLCACSVPIFFFVNGYLVGCRKNDPKTILKKILNLLKLRFCRIDSKNISFFDLHCFRIIQLSLV